MLDKRDEEVRKLRHSAAHLLAAAVLKTRPQARPTIGPATDDGFYYDFDLGAPLSAEELPEVEKTMSEIVSVWHEFSHREVSAQEAREIFSDNQYKIELIDEIESKGEKITLYTAGGFTDLCRGGHVENPAKELKHFKLLKVAGAYWRGNENRAMLTRIYGTAFKTKQDLDEYLNLLEEAKKRDHRKLGKELDLFTFSPLVGPGLPLFTPRGTVIREELIRFIQSLQEARGYERVTIPHLALPELYKTSGHWDKFSDDIFHVRGKNDSEFVLKPMNCPHHTQIYAGVPRSYRDLPQRYSEVTMMYRDEQAGQLAGLTRVRSISIDDAHVFCAAEQTEDEINLIFDIIDDFYAAFDFEVTHRLSLRDPDATDKYLGGAADWDDAEAKLRSVLQAKSVPFHEVQGEAAFYGPKIDFIARDSLRREWQLSTIQLDFNLPERFNLTYTDESGAAKRVIMIHRAISGSLERFMAILLEHYNGALPLWLAPVQAMVLPISDDQVRYAQAAAEQLRAAGLRVGVDHRAESIGKKIREAETQKVPVMLVVGKKEAADGTLAIRWRETGNRSEKKISEVVADLRDKVSKRS